MPHQPKKNVDEIFDSIKELNFFNNQGQVLKLSDPIWKHAETILMGEMTAKYLYLYLSQNRNRILERFQEKSDINVRVNRKLSKSLSSIDSTKLSRKSSNSNWSMSPPFHLKPWRTIIYLDAETWMENVWNS